MRLFSLRFSKAAGVAAALALLAGAGPAALAQSSKNVQDRTAAAAEPAASAKRPPSDPNLIAPDPDIRRGVLPNGMRYAVMRNATPAKAVSLRLFVDVGSYEEGDDERGAAHFLEHMAFNGTKNFPEGELDRVLAPAGVQFGRDHNAATGLFSTTYMLDLPGAEAAKVDLAFRWLRDVADGITFDEAAVRRERGVVMSEHDASLSPSRSVAVAIGEFLAKGMRSVSRDPIGTRASIQTMEAATLRGFYERWYRPENAVVVVVGDVPVDDLERRVIAGFSSWRGKGAAPQRATGPKVDTSRKAEVLVRSEPTLTTFLGACHVGQPDPRGPVTVASMRQRLDHELWMSIVNERLTALASAEQPPFLGAMVSYDDSSRELASTCLTAVPLQDDWQGALAAASQELRRFAAHGPTAAELERALEARRSLLRGAAGGAATRPTPDMANYIVAHEAELSASPDPKAYFAAYDRAVAGMTGETVRAAMNRDWAGSGPLLMVAAPQAPPAQEVLALWSRSQEGKALEQVVAAAPQSWAYTRFGRPGRVVKREVVDPPGFSRLTFANGVVLNFKQTSYAADRVSVRVRFGAGRGGVPREQLFAASIGTELLVEGGLGKHDADTVRRIFSDRGWGADIAMLDTAFIMSGAAASNGLESQLQIMAAYLSDPGFRSTVDARLPTAIDAIYRMHRTDPNLVLSEALSEAITPNNPLALPPQERLAQLRTRDFERLFKPALTSAPIEATIVGDVTEAEAIRLVSETLGALPRRTGEFKRRPDSWWVRYPTQPVSTVRAVHEGPVEKAVVAVVWPLYVADPARRREEFSLNLVATVLNDALRHKIREELGKSYAPSAGIEMPDFADQGAITVIVETSPADAEAVAREIREVGEEMARGGITQAMLDAARTPFLEQRRQFRDSNDWWMGAMDGSAEDPTNLNDFLTYEGIFASLSLAEVKKAASDWLSKPPLTAISAPPAAAVRAAAGQGGASGGGR
ncbi:MAG TPA: insulinase family protein [Caulobacteraceae bacterium]|nr:insulinase family protein [Caulobacteraceae bacterium]